MIFIKKYIIILKTTTISDDWLTWKNMNQWILMVMWMNEYFNHEWSKTLMYLLLWREPFWLMMIMVVVLHFNQNDAISKPVWDHYRCLNSSQNIALLVHHHHVHAFLWWLVMVMAVFGYGSDGRDFWSLAMAVSPPNPFGTVPFLTTAKKNQAASQQRRLSEWKNILGLRQFPQPQNIRYPNIQIDLDMQMDFDIQIHCFDIDLDIGYGGVCVGLRTTVRTAIQKWFERSGCARNPFAYPNIKTKTSVFQVKSERAEQQGCATVVNKFPQDTLPSKN